MWVFFNDFCPLNLRHNIITHSTTAMLFGLAHNESSDSFLLGSVPDSSPVHGDSPDEVLRRRHGDKEVRISQFRNRYRQITFKKKKKKAHIVPMGELYLVFPCRKSWKSSGG